MDKGARNDLSAAVPKFCLALEEYRRTPEGRVRTSQDLLATFFPYDDKSCTDKVFKFLPNEVRGPIIAAWGIRGMKAALRDSDDRVQQVVYDAVVAGDVDHQAFEDGLGAETLVRWVPLSDLWSFWRQGKLSKQAIHKAIATAYELYLFDARWFLETITAKGGSLKGTDVLADGLTKDDLTQWVRRIHETGDGTPKGIVAALGWEKIVTKTANDVLIAVLDAVVTKVGLVSATAKDSSPRVSDVTAPKAEPKPEPPPATAVIAPKPEKAGAQEKTAPTAPRTLERPNDEPTWSVPPPVHDTGSALSTEDGIQVVLDEEEEAPEKIPSPTSPNIEVPAHTTATAPAPADEDDTQVRPSLRRSERPPARPPGNPRSR